MSHFPFNWKLAKALQGENKATWMRRGHIAVLECAPQAAGAATIHAAMTLTASASDITSGFVAGILAKLAACPQILSITGAMAGASLTGNVVITGTDIGGNAATDTIALNNNATVVGVVAFASIANVHLPVKVTTADTVTIGTVKSSGVPFLSGHFVVALQKFYDGSTDAGTLTLDASDVSKSKYVPAGACDGTKVVQLTLVIADTLS